MLDYQLDKDPVSADLSPKTGRFLSIDPFFEKFASQSPYQYAYNNPISFKDPTGFEPESEKGGNDRMQMDVIMDDVAFSQRMLTVNSRLFCGEFDYGGGYWWNLEWAIFDNYMINTYAGSGGGGPLCPDMASKADGWTTYGYWELFESKEQWKLEHPEKVEQPRKGKKDSDNGIKTKVNPVNSDLACNGDLPSNKDGTPWMKTAEGEIGECEIQGSEDNPRILEYFSATNYPAINDETPWCSAFVNWCFSQNGIIGTNSASAYSWCGWNNGVSLDDLAFGSVVYLSSSHVTFCAGLVEGTNGKYFWGLGGNQSDCVRYSKYPISGIGCIMFPSGYNPNYTLPTFSIYKKK